MYGMRTNPDYMSPEITGRGAFDGGTQDWFDFREALLWLAAGVDRQSTSLVMHLVTGQPRFPTAARSWIEDRQFGLRITLRNTEFSPYQTPHSTDQALGA